MNAALVLVVAIGVSGLGVARAVSMSLAGMGYKPPQAALEVPDFTGFNPLLNQNLNLPAGATLTMVTELKVEKEPLPTLVWWLVAAIALALGLGLGLVVRRSRRVS